MTVPGLVGEDKSRRIVRERCGGRCEMCGRSGPLEFAHRKGRAQLGLWTPSNGIAACPTCHAFQHAHPEEARQMGWHVSGAVKDELVHEVPVKLLTWLGIGWYKLLPWGGYDVLDLAPVEPTVGT